MKSEGVDFYVGTMDDVNDLHKDFFIEIKVCNNPVPTITQGNRQCNRIFFERMLFLKDDRQMDPNANFEKWKLVEGNDIAPESKQMLDRLYQQEKEKIENQEQQ